MTTHTRGRGSAALARSCAALVVGVLALAAAPAHAEIKLENGWLRPAYAGQAAAMVYVDIHATLAWRLVSASSPVAKGAQLVLVDPPSADVSTHRVVREIPLAANQETRLAYLGSHVRLTGIRQDLKPGDAVPLTLTFAAANGKRVTATTQARVRGITARRPPEPATPTPAQ